MIIDLGRKGTFSESCFVNGETWIVNPFHLRTDGERFLGRQGPIKGFRIAPMNPAKRLPARKPKPRRGL